eukprot:3501605-Alexandrium_andersonii.AAC.1
MLACGKVDTSRRPWALRPNGDLWKHLHGLLQQRGMHSLHIAKVKAHLGVQDVARGTISAQDQRGNSIADRCVGEVARGGEVGRTVMRAW